MKIDREKWDRRYQVRYTEGIPGPRRWLSDHADLLTGGRALDIACGVGRSALFAAQHGYVVDAVDISIEGLKQLRHVSEKLGLPINPIQADLDHFPLPILTYDLVMVFYFLDRRLFGPIKEALRPGGLLIYETFNAYYLRVMPGIERDKLLVPAELCRAFGEWEILDYRELTDGDRPVGSLVARKPGNAS